MPGLLTVFQEWPQSWEGGAPSAGTGLGVGCEVLGLPESGCQAQERPRQEALRIGLQGPPPRFRPGRALRGLEAGGSFSAPWFPNLSRDSPFLNVQGPLCRARPEQDRVLDRHGSSIGNPCSSHPTPDAVSLFFSTLTPGPRPSPSAQRRKPWAAPWGPSQPALCAVQPPVSPSLPARTPFLLHLRAQPSHCRGDQGAPVPCCWHA